MNMDLSSQELFHFTKYENLNRILKVKSFFPRYNLEFTVLSESYKRRAALLPIAMVCFCDIPLELSNNHRKRYGNSGIVLSEKWKIKNGLNPIIYIQKESTLANIFANLANIPETFLPLIFDYSKDIRVPRVFSETTENLQNLTYFLKQFENNEEIRIDYEGKIRIFEKRKFYDEREWRYIPFVAKLQNELFLNIRDFDDSEKLRIANKRLEKYKLDFALDDIKYLVVEKDIERDELLELLGTKNEIEIRVLPTS